MLCPKCGKTYTGHPALSRVDNKTEICPACGYREALEAAGISEEVQEKILNVIADASHKIKRKVT